jgi:limonene-1,2-epoxide hydrolase
VIALTLSERPGIRNGICGRVVLTGKTMAMVEPASAEGVVRDFMAACKAAWPTGNATTLARFFSDEAEYRNGPLNPVKGRAAIAASLAAMMGMGGEVDADIRHLVADGPVVVTERVDYWKSGEKMACLRIAGVFEVHDGVITAWRDYFDANEFTSQLSTD